MIIPIWVREKEKGTTYVAYQVPSVDSIAELDSDLRDNFVIKVSELRKGIVYGPELCGSLQTLAHYITMRIDNDREQTLPVCTPSELSHGFIVGDDYIDRKLSEQEMTELQREILVRLGRT